MLNGLITGNRATPNDGGGIYVSNTSASPLYNVQINGGTISGNTAAGHGGGIYAAPQQSTTAYFSLSDSVITGNSAGGNGGGLYKSGQSPVNIINTLISDNDAVNGAGIFQFRDTISLLGTTLISANRASGDGGGVYVSGPTVSGQTWSSWFTMSGYAAVSDNIASGNGGGISLYNSNSMIINNTIAYNDAENGGVNDIFEGVTFKIEGVNEKLKKELKNILHFINENPLVQTDAIKQFSKKGKRTIERYLKILKDNDLIEYVGSDKTGGYKIKNNKNVQ